MKKTARNYSLLMMLVFAFSLFNHAHAQKKPASPPKIVNASVNGKDITISYSAPYKKGREIFGGLVAYDKVWRTGANDATTIEVSADVMIAGNTLKKGTYALFTIPNEDTWTVIFNEEAKQWGSYDYTKDKDVFRFEVKPKTVSETEQFEISLSPEGMVSLAWDTTKISFEIK